MARAREKLVDAKRAIGEGRSGRERLAALKHADHRPAALADGRGDFVEFDAITFDLDLKIDTFLEEDMSVTPLSPIAGKIGAFGTAPDFEPAQDKQREKRRLKEAKSFGEFGERWMSEARMADSTRAMRRSIFERDILPTLRNRLLTEMTPDDVRALCFKVKDRGAPATAIHVRDIIKLERF